MHFMPQHFACGKLLTTHPAKIAPKFATNHSAELKPLMHTPCAGSSPNCFGKEKNTNLKQKLYNFFFNYSPTHKPLSYMTTVHVLYKNYDHQLAQRPYGCAITSIIEINCNCARLSKRTPEHAIPLSSFSRP